MGHLNTVTLFGAVCRTPRVRLLSESEFPLVQFQLAVNRPFRRPAPPALLTFEEEEALTDYPWVYVRGALAQKCADALQIGTLVMVSGRLQTRFVPTRWPWPLHCCPHCGTRIEADTAEVESLTVCPMCSGSLILPEHTTVEVHASVVEPTHVVLGQNRHEDISLPPEDLDDLDVVSGPGASS